MSTIANWKREFYGFAVEMSALGLAPVDADPTTPPEGLVWYNAASHTLKVQTDAGPIDLLAGDISAVSAGDGLTGGGTTGAISLAVDYGLVASVQAVGDAAAVGSSKKLARIDHAHALGGSVGGDLSGTLPNPTVAKIGGTSVAGASTATNGGAGNAGKLAKLDADGKLAGRVLETDGSKLDGIDAGAKALDATAADIAPLGASKVAGAVGKAADAGHVHQADKAAFRVAYFTGVDASGGASHVDIAALKAGDQVLDVFNITDGTDGTASFEATVTVNGELQQPALNLSAKSFKALFVAKS